jgi:hypothetical protein
VSERRAKANSSMMRRYYSEVVKTGGTTDLRDKSARNLITGHPSGNHGSRAFKKAAMANTSSGSDFFTKILEYR